VINPNLPPNHPRNRRSRELTQGVYKPSLVTMRQARLALLDAGLYDQIGTLLDAMPEPQRSAAKIEWEFATEVNKAWPLLVTLTAALGLNQTQVDNLFIEASKL